RLAGILCRDALGVGIEAVLNPEGGRRVGHRQGLPFVLHCLAFGVMRDDLYVRDAQVVLGDLLRMGERVIDLVRGRVYPCGRVETELLVLIDRGFLVSERGLDIRFVGSRQRADREAERQTDYQNDKTDQSQTHVGISLMVDPCIPRAALLRRPAASTSVSKSARRVPPRFGVIPEFQDVRSCAYQKLQTIENG